MPRRRRRGHGFGAGIGAGNGAQRRHRHREHRGEYPKPLRLDRQLAGFDAGERERGQRIVTEARAFRGEPVDRPGALFP
jgi:hypothetical protein